MKKPLYILDAYGLIYRSYFAFINKPLTNNDGKNVSAIFGFFRNIHAVLEQYSPVFFIAAFDSRTPTFRHEMYPEYKANRQKTPEDLHEQVPIIEEIITALGIHIIRHDGFEADDIIASIAVRCKQEKRDCVILSGDKDLMQLVGDGVSILKPSKLGGWEKVDSQGVLSEWGVSPERMIDLLSLVGDASDNIPGVKGVGEKTALKLINEYGTLDGIYEHIEEITGSIGTKLLADKENAYFSRSLIELCTEVPIHKDLDSYCCTTLDYVSGARVLYREGLPTVARLLSKDPEVKQNTKEDSVRKDTAHHSNAADLLQGENSRKFLAPLSQELPQTEQSKATGNYRTITNEQELSEIISQAITKGIVAFDCETTGLNVYKDSLVGLSLSLESATGFYIPISGPSPELGEESHPLHPIDSAFKQLRRLFSSKSTTVIMHNGKFDMQILHNAGLFCNDGEKIECRLFDTMIAAWLLDPDWLSFSLESLASSQLQLQTISYADIVPKGKTFADVSIPLATSYAAEDADITMRLYSLFSPKLKEHGFENLFLELEMPLVPILANMEIIGIHLETKPLQAFSVELESSINATEKEIFSIVGHEFNIASPKQLQEVLFVERKLTPGKKTKTGYSTDTSVLEDLAAEDILPAKILDYRGLAKLKSTYVDALPELADSEGRIHTSFIQTGTATGRLSSRDPNLQNIPIRDDHGRRIRSAFTSGKGLDLISADYAQIELVLLAHLSQDANLIEAFTSGVDVHKRTASLIFNVETDDVTADMRRVAKTINFGVMYGMSAFRLSNELRIPRGQAAQFISSYFSTYEGVKNYITTVKENARKMGYVETIMGRRRYIRGINSTNKLEQAGAERIAVNTPIQGSAADIVKKAMIEVSTALFNDDLQAKLLLQVHDELIFHSPVSQTQKVCSLVKAKMEAVISLSVPLRVSIEAGKNWGEFH